LKLKRAKLDIARRIGEIGMIECVECIAPQLQAVDRLFTLELESRLECVNVLVRHVSRFRGKMLRPCLVLLAGRACGADALTDAHVTIAPPDYEECNAGVGLYTPNKVGWPVAGTEDAPVVNVSWCQSHAYCQWSGKRLCGKIGGGPLPKLYETNATESQWFNACTHQGTNAFPYGNTYDDQACVGPGVGAK